MNTSSSLPSFDDDTRDLLQDLELSTSGYSDELPSLLDSGDVDYHGEPKESPPEIGIVIDCIPFSRSFSDLNLLKDAPFTSIPPPVPHLPECSLSTQQSSSSRISYHIENITNIYEAIPDWDDDDIEEIILITPKLPALREEQDLDCSAFDQSADVAADEDISISQVDISEVTDLSSYIADFQLNHACDSAGNLAESISSDEDGDYLQSLESSTTTVRARVETAENTPEQETMLAALEPTTRHFMRLSFTPPLRLETRQPTIAFTTSEDHSELSNRSIVIPRKPEKSRPALLKSWSRSAVSPLYRQTLTPRNMSTSFSPLSSLSASPMSPGGSPASPDASGTRRARSLSNFGKKLRKKASRLALLGSSPVQGSNSSPLTASGPNTPIPFSCSGDTTVHPTPDAVASKGAANVQLPSTFPKTVDDWSLPSSVSPVTVRSMQNLCSTSNGTPNTGTIGFNHMPQTPSKFAFLNSPDGLSKTHGSMRTLKHRFKQVLGLEEDKYSPTTPTQTPRTRKSSSIARHFKNSSLISALHRSKSHAHAFPPPSTGNPETPLDNHGNASYMALSAHMPTHHQENGDEVGTMRLVEQDYPTYENTIIITTSRQVTTAPMYTSTAGDGVGLGVIGVAC